METTFLSTHAKRITLWSIIRHEADRALSKIIEGEVVLQQDSIAEIRELLYRLENP